jgi:hypothetical protein
MGPCSFLGAAVRGLTAWGLHPIDPMSLS